jgi:hypothetical protein
MKIDANLNEVKEIEALPSGIYQAVILTEPRAILSREKKTPGIEFELTFTDPGTEIAPGVARTMRHTVYRSEKLGWQHIGMKEICEAAGVSLENPDTADFINRTINVAVTTEPYVDKRSGENKIFNKIDYLLKAS